MKHKQTDTQNESVIISDTSEQPGDKISKFKANLEMYLNFSLTYCSTVSAA